MTLKYFDVIYNGQLYLIPMVKYTNRDWWTEYNTLYKFIIVYLLDYYHRNASIGATIPTMQSIAGSASMLVSIALTGVELKLNPIEKEILQMIPENLIRKI